VRTGPPFLDRQASNPLLQTAVRPIRRYRRRRRQGSASFRAVRAQAATRPARPICGYEGSLHGTARQPQGRFERPTECAPERGRFHNSQLWVYYKNESGSRHNSERSPFHGGGRIRLAQSRVRHAGRSVAASRIEGDSSVHRGVQSEHVVVRCQRLTEVPRPPYVCRAQGPLCEVSR
jgi:hypothetical protein